MSGQRKLGNILMETAAINSKQLAEALAVQIRWNAQSNRRLRIGDILLAQRFVNLSQLHSALRIQGPKPMEENKKAEEDVSWITKTRFKL